MSRRIKFSRFMTMYFLGMSWWNFFFYAVAGDDAW